MPFNGVNNYFQIEGSFYVFNIEFACTATVAVPSMSCLCHPVSLNIDYLLTDCEVCTGKYLLEVFVKTERRREEVCVGKTKGKDFPAQTEQTRLIRNLSYGFWFPSSL